MPGGAPGLQNQRGVRKGPRWVRFPFTSAILLAGGVGLFVLGVGFHRAAVLEESEEEVEIEVPSPWAPLVPGQAPGAEESPADAEHLPPSEPPGPGGLPGVILPGLPSQELPGGMASGMVPPFAPPIFVPPQKQKVVRVVQKPGELPEPRLIYAATIGAVARLETGELRLIAGAREGPALCPT